MVLLLISVGLMAVTARAMVRVIAADWADRFWLYVLIIPALLGLVSILTSAFGAFDGPWFLACQALLAAPAVLAAARWGKGVAGPRPREQPMDPASMLLVAGIFTVLAVSLIHDLAFPISGYDERMYHGSRAAYWVQNRSILFFRTHNDRQVAFPGGAELFFAWPLLFVKNDVIARAFFWAAVPAGGAGVASLCRVIGLNRRAALAGALAYLGTPSVIILGSGLKSDLWAPLHLLGAAYFVLRPAAPGQRSWAPFVLAGAMLAVAMNIKMTALGFAPGLVLAAVLRRPGLRNIGALAAGGAVGALVCGLAVLIASNLSHYGRPLGPEWLSTAVSPHFSARQLWVHAGRTPVFLLELPELPMESARRAWEKVGAKVARRLGADRALPLEDNPSWPGIFQYRAPSTGTNFALGGILWLPLLGIASVRAVREGVRSWPRPVLSPQALLALMQLPLLAGVIFLIRWMGDGPGRFWLGAYALYLPLAVGIIDRWASRWRVAAAAAIALLFMAVSAAVRGDLWRLDWFRLHPPGLDQTDEPYHEVTPLLPPGARTLLVCGPSTRDYPLFAPRSGFTNAVYPWGVREFEATAMERMLTDHDVTHVLVEDDQALSFMWRLPVDAKPMVQWLQARPDLEEVPLKTPHMRLFRRVPPRGTLEHAWRGPLTPGARAG